MHNLQFSQNSIWRRIGGQTYSRVCDEGSSSDGRVNDDLGIRYGDLRFEDAEQSREGIGIRQRQTGLLDVIVRDLLVAFHRR